MRFLLLEDDASQSAWIAQELKLAFDGCSVDVIETEEEFRKRLDETVALRPDAVLIDVMVRWTNPSPEMQRPPEDVIEGGPFRAGLRCARILNAANKEIRLVLYTILDRADLQDELRELHDLDVHVACLRKDHSPGRLREQIRKILQLDGPGTATP